MVRTYEEFKAGVQPSVSELVDSLRSYCLSLGSDVIEVAHMQRLTYCTKQNPNFFADFEVYDHSILFKRYMIGYIVKFYEIKGTKFSCLNYTHLNLRQLRKIIRMAYKENNTKENCPKCESANVAVITYRYLEATDWWEKALKEEKVVLRDFNSNEVPKKWRCDKCHWEWK